METRVVKLYSKSRWKNEDRKNMQKCPWTLEQDCITPPNSDVVYMPNQVIFLCLKSSTGQLNQMYIFTPTTLT